jgi:hypothetical protein
MTSTSALEIDEGVPVMLDIWNVALSCRELLDELGDGRGWDPRIDIEFEREDLPDLEGIEPVTRGADGELASSIATTASTLSIQSITFSGFKSTTQKASVKVKMFNYSDK